jgi:5-(carboxyamino)imidazole ribonucleotide synthase
LNKVIPPGSSIGILGGGQLARMLALAAKPLGYRVIVLDPDADCPASSVCDAVIAANFDDVNALEELAKRCDVITLEFENVPEVGLSVPELQAKMRPSREVLRTSRDRILEKSFLNSIGVPTAPWKAITSGQDLAGSSFPGILKTATLGYDGKGQVRVANQTELEIAFQQFNQQVNMPCVLEGLINFEKEVSVIVARSSSGEARAFPVFENRHENGILDVTLWPAQVPESTLLEAERLALEIAIKLEVIGLLTVEMFVTAKGGVMVNELAPRPHNSGHLSIEASPTSQFEQAIRAVCGLKLGEVMPHGPSVMVNLLGDLWPKNAEPNWAAALEVAGVHLHLYGKREARPGRKMGHITALGQTREEALAQALQARQVLVSQQEALQARQVLVSQQEALEDREQIR